MYNANKMATSDNWDDDEFEVPEIEIKDTYTTVTPMGCIICGGEEKLLFCGCLFCLKCNIKDFEQGLALYCLNCKSYTGALSFLNGKPEKYEYAEIYDYTEAAGFNINAIIKHDPKDPRIASLNDAIVRCFNANHTHLEKDVVLHHGGRRVKNSPYACPVFPSCTTNEKVAARFQKGGKVITFKFDCKQVHASIMRYSFHPNEDEILLPQGTVITGTVRVLSLFN
jgi:hypothetical protein